jgi:hypothetical protein
MKKKKRSLGVYVIGVIVALVMVNSIVWYMGRLEELKSVELLSVGFLLGMLAMYIAVHLSLEIGSNIVYPSEQG